MLTMRRTIGDEALLSKTLQESVLYLLCTSPELNKKRRITDMAYTVFYSAVEAQGRALLRTSLVSYLVLIRLFVRSRMQDK
jgi:hypothetical protein